MTSYGMKYRAPFVMTAVISTIIYVTINQNCSSRDRVQSFQISKSRHLHRSDTETENNETLESELFIEKLHKDVLTYDVRRLPSGTNSRLHLDRRAVSLGEVFKIRIHQYDDYNHPLHRGGDLLAVLMDNSTLGATSVGCVIDHRNGSYTAILRAIWRGTATISVSVLCAREAISTNMRIANLYTAVQRLYCVFEYDGMRTETLGYPSTDPFKGRNFCNMTIENYGLAWYCLEPDNRFLCSDWVKVKVTARRKLYDAKSEKDVFNESAKTERKIGDIKVMMVTGQYDTILDHRKTCIKHDVISTWMMSVPEEFLYKGQWHRMSCISGMGDYSLRKCLSNRHLLLLGDSTLRQFYSSLFKRLQMKSLTGNWTTEQWHRQNRSQREDLNFKTIWTTHELPLYFSDTALATARPVYVNVDEIPSGSNDLVVIHMYAHFINHQPQVYRESI